MRSTAFVPSAERGALRLRWPSVDLWPLLLVACLIVGCALVLATTEIGSGDYGQWLMTARPYLGENVPDYRAASVVPPVMPFLLSVAVRLVGDPLLAVHLFAVALLACLGLSAYLAGATFFGSRISGLVAAVSAMLFTDRFLELFAFGGLLQAGAIVFVWLSAAAMVRAARTTGPEWPWWWTGGVTTGLAALTHVGTASIAIPTGVVVGVLSARWRVSARREVLRRMVPLGLSLLVVGAYWVAFLLPGGTEFAQNPASLAYRGPGRLVDALTAYPGTVLMVAIALAGLGLGLRSDLRRRRVGTWTVVGAWIAVTLAVVMGAVVTGAATDYPRFATPLLAPVVIAAGGTGAMLIRTAGRWPGAREGRLTGPEWSLSIAAAILAVAAWPAVGAFGTQANGYQMAAPASLQQAVSWVDDHVAAGATILAPVREGKWIEGLSGRPALFSSAVRYSFRPDEWRRSVAADAVLRSGGALVNEYFFVRLTDDIADATVPRGMSIGVNHGGEYIDLLRIAPAGVRILNAGDSTTLATLPNLAGTSRSATGDGNAASVTSAWSGDRQGGPVTYSETVSLLSEASTLELVASASAGGPTGFELLLHPSQLAVTRVSISGAEADLSFAVAGSAEPAMRVVLAGSGTSLSALPDGSLRIRSSGGQIRLLLTDLSGVPLPTVGPGFVDPAAVVNAYQIGAVLLVRDAAFDSRRVRLEALGFELRQIFGPYAVMVR